MPDIDLDITEHKIHLYPDAKQVKQKLCSKPEWALKIKEEVQK